MPQEGHRGCHKRGTEGVTLGPQRVSKESHRGCNERGTEDVTGGPQRVSQEATEDVKEVT